MSHYDEMKNLIIKETELSFSEWKTTGISQEKQNIVELSLVVYRNNVEEAEFIFKPDGSFDKVRSLL
jgi:hypothetical protein